MAEGTDDRARRLEECTRALAASEARVRNLIINHVDGIVIVDEEGVVRFVNPAAEALFNRPAATLVGYPFGFSAVAGETSEVDVLRAGGEVVAAEMRVVATEWEGEPACLASLRDVTARKRAEEERLALAREQAARAEAEEASRLKDAFLGTVSHELRTPLNVILGWTRILLAGALDPAAQRRALETIERHAELQAKIVDDLLDVSRITTGRLALDIRAVDPAEVASAAAEALRLAARAKGIAIHVEADPAAGPIMADPIRLQQVIVNVLSNAVKFTPPGGHVEVRVERAGPQIVLSVRDDGPGIDREFLPFVFGQFRQADGSTTRRHGGLGLGLAIARHLVELHGGQIEVDSPGLGRGTTVRVSLPVAAIRREDTPVPPGTLPGPASARDALPDLHTVRVLVVEDEPDARELMTAILTARGAEVTAVGSAEGALEELVERPYDVLVSDIGMPGKDGYTLLKEVRSRTDGVAAIPAVALTAYARSEERARALEAGYQRHVAKPVDPAELVATVAELARALPGDASAAPR